MPYRFNPYNEKYYNNANLLGCGRFSNGKAFLKAYRKTHQKSFPPKGSKAAKQFMRIVRAHKRK